MPPKKRSSLAAVGAGIASTPNISRPTSSNISRPNSSCMAVRPDSSTKLVRPDSSTKPEDIVEIEGVPWSKSVPMLHTCRERGVVVAQTNLRGTSLGQIRDLEGLMKKVAASGGIHDSNGSRQNVSVKCVSHEAVNMYHLCDNIVVPLTARYSCSWMELVAAGPQPPTWFVSHWWGTPFQQTAELLKFHASQRGSFLDTIYWICTFANNQHDLSELGGSLRETPFVKAILSHQCKGTLTLLDNGVTTFERIWCVLENFVSTTWTQSSKSSPHFLDFAAYLPAGSATFGGKPVPAKPTLRMDLGNGRWKEQVDDESTGGAFPLTVSLKGSCIDIFNAKSSRKEDRRNILHLIAATPEDSWGTVEPPETCDAYDDLNLSARKVFAAGAMYAAAIRADDKMLAGLLGAFPDVINESISDGATSVYAAAWKNNTTALRMLLCAKANPNSHKDDGATPLFIAAQTGHEKAVSELLEANADPNLARDHVTPCFMAVQNKHADVLKVLLAANANPDVPNSQGVTPLLLASQQGYEHLVKKLLESKADATIASDNGNTPMSIAKSHAVINLLLEAKCNVDLKCGRSVQGDIIHGLTSMSSSSLAPPAAKSKPKAKSKVNSVQPFAHSLGVACSGPSRMGLIGMYEACENETAELSSNLHCPPSRSHRKKGH